MRPAHKGGPARHHCETQDHGLDKALDNRLIELARPALERGEKVTIETPIRNINRTVGTMLSGEIAKRYGYEGLPDETIHVRLAGSAGQSSALSSRAACGWISSATPTTTAARGSRAAG